MRRGPAEPQDSRPERQLRPASRRAGGGIATPMAAAMAIEAEQMVDHIEGSLLRPDIDDPNRCCIDAAPHREPVEARLALLHAPSRLYLLYFSLII